MARTPAAPPLAIGWFFEEFRRELAELPEGLARLAPPATSGDIRAAERRLGRPLPAGYAAFLRSCDGADLFHEAIVVSGAGARAFAPLLKEGGEIAFAESAGGDRFVFAPDSGGGEDRVVRCRADDNERWLSGSNFTRWISAMVARERVLYGPDGEFLLEAFETDGEELTPMIALRQAERGLRHDPGSSEGQHDLAVAFHRLNRAPQSLSAFARSAELDPQNPWPWFHLGRAQLDAADPTAAAESFRRAAGLAACGTEAARFFALALSADLPTPVPARLRLQVVKSDPVSARPPRPRQSKARRPAHPGRGKPQRS